MPANGRSGDQGNSEVGVRVARARHARGLTRKELAREAGVSLWTVEQLEEGRPPASLPLSRIAEALGTPLASLELSDGHVATADPVASESIARPLAPTERAGRNAILASLALIVLVRFFTEVVPALPQVGNFIDIPLLGLLWLLVLVSPLDSTRRIEQTTDRFGVLAFAFLMVATLAAVANPTRVEPAPALVFVYGFLAPLAFYLCTYRLWPAGQAMSLSRLIVALGIVQFAVVAVVDLPKFVSDGNPDHIAGTFGQNPYQLVFFLLIFAAVVAGAATFERGRTVARFAPILLAGTFLVIFLAQYRALLVATALTVIVVGVMLSLYRGRGFMIAAVFLGCFVVGLSYVTAKFPTSKFGPTVAAIRETPTVFLQARLRPIRDVFSLYSNEPTVAIIGTGPGTYSSRAWRTFAEVGELSSAEGAETSFAGALTGGRAYSTDVSDRYVLPRVQNARSEALLGSAVAAAPFSSWGSTLAEVGLIGFFLVVALYVVGLVRAGRSTSWAMTHAPPGDPLPALALATFVGFFLLLQMAFLENWLEVTRVTVPAWVLLAVVTKELAARTAAARS